jgi:hypothetical protein
VFARISFNFRGHFSTIFVSCPEKLCRISNEWIKVEKKVEVNVLLVMGNNFLSDNFALRSLIGPQLANWIIGQNFGN